MMGLDILDEIVGKDKSQPDSMDNIYYLFWEKGIDYNAFCKLPIPYIFRIIKTFNWVKKEEEKANKKAKRK